MAYPRGPQQIWEYSGASYSRSKNLIRLPYAIVCITHLIATWCGLPRLHLHSKMEDCTVIPSCDCYASVMSVVLAVYPNNSFWNNGRKLDLTRVDHHLGEERKNWRKRNHRSRSPWHQETYQQWSIDSTWVASEAVLWLGRCCPSASLCNRRHDEQYHNVAHHACRSGRRTCRVLSTVRSFLPSWHLVRL